MVILYSSFQYSIGQTSPGTSDIMIRLTTCPACLLKM